MKQSKPKIGNLGFSQSKKVASIKKSRPAWGVFTFGKDIWQLAGGRAAHSIGSPNCNRPINSRP